MGMNLQNSNPTKKPQQNMNMQDPVQNFPQDKVHIFETLKIKIILLFFKKAVNASFFESTTPRYANGE